MANKAKFNYGQWSVRLVVRKPMCLYDEVHVSILIDGNWRCTSGSYYEWVGFAKYDNPEILPQGLKDRINKRCKSMLA